MLEGQALVLQIILALRLEGGSYVNKMLRTRFKDTTRMTMYRAIGKLKATGLIADELRDRGGRGGITREYFLTPAGQEVAEHLLAIENTLKFSAREAKKRKQAGIDR